MKKILMAFLGTLILVVAPMSVLADDKPAPPPPKIKVGDMAPDFSLKDTTGKEVSLKDYRGKKNVVLAFYVFAFTGG